MSGSVVALLRAVNLGPVNRIAMGELRSALAEAGFVEPRTLLASGNVVLATDEAPEAVARAVERVIADAFGVEVPVIARTGAELADVIAATPFADIATDGSRHFVAFCAQEIPPDAFARLEGSDWGEERWAVRGRELYLWLPDGIGRSPLGATLARPPLGPATTVRNFNTVTKLQAMAAPATG